MSNETHVTPPQWPLRFMRFFIRKRYLEEIEGDMEEIFYDDVATLTVRQAKRKYVWEILKLMRPVLIRNLEGVEQLNQYGMFKNYFKVSLRGLVKNPLNSFINVFGLAVAIGTTVFAYAFARWTFNTDQFHQYKEQVHLVTFAANRDGTLQQFGQTPRPLGEMLKEDFTHIKKVCRVDDRNVIVKSGDNVFHERVRLVDPEFLEMLTFPLRWGSASSLRDVNSIILSENMSLKYFGEENPIGRDLLIKFDETHSKAFKVTGVAEKFPDAHTIEFGFLINFENFRTADPSYDYHDWSAFVRATLIQIEKPTDLTSVVRGMEKYKAMQNEAVEQDWAIESFSFEPLATLHRKSSEIRDDISASSDSKYESIVFIAIIVSFMLALACFNYINIAIVSAAKRLKEIGVRKTIGATKRVVIVQFLTENVLITFFALLVGIILGTFVFIPWLESINHFSLEFTLVEGNLWLYLPAVLLLTGIASGIYPSFYISRFQVVGIMRGSVRFGQKNPLTKVFLAFQLVLACVLITAGVLFTRNADYMAQRSWGYDQHQVLYVAVPDQAAFDKLHALITQIPEVVSISGSQHHLGKSHTTSILRKPDRQFEVEEMSVDPNYFATVGLQLSAGRTFRENYESDKKTIVVNESLVSALALQNALGELFRIDSVQYEIIGVVEDFHSYSFFKKVNPAIFKVAEKETFRFLSMKVREGSEVETAKRVQARWAQLYPEIPFSGGFQEDVWGNYYEQIRIHARVWKGFAIIAVLLASLGLYGLVTLNVAGRVKEFSIRKILGAGIPGIARNITREYVLLYIIGLSIGAPVSYYLNKTLFDMIYWYHIPITYAGVSVAVIILILVLLTTVSTQIRKVFTSNPVDGLKME